MTVRFVPLDAMGEFAAGRRGGYSLRYSLVRDYLDRAGRTASEEVAASASVVYAACEAMLARLADKVREPRPDGSRGRAQDE